MKRSTQLAELKTPVKRSTLHKLTARCAFWRTMVANQTNKGLRITWVKNNPLTSFRQGCCSPHRKLARLFIGSGSGYCSRFVSLFFLLLEIVVEEGVGEGGGVLN